MVTDAREGFEEGKGIWVRIYVDVVAVQEVVKVRIVVPYVVSRDYRAKMGDISCSGI